MTYKQWTVKVRPHPGSSSEEIANEPNWGAGHQHRVGYRDKANRKPGFTSEDSGYRDEIQEAKREMTELKREETSGKLVNFRDLISHQPVRPDLGSLEPIED